MSERLAVLKTYKLYVGGKFPRSESGRTYRVQDSNVARASRKDVRDAVKAARAACAGWAGATAYNRGQVLYRVAEVLEGRRAQFTALGSSESELDDAIDRWVWYAGWADKLAQVVGGANPVAGPYFNLSAPEPTGVVGIVAPASPLLGLTSVI
ncbi:MAG: aldehyde dehydrogenase family protein, partial [Longispora sp.]|nr:aldehyde dehydrogenase family protein [Longispora sp. (in: high G+C Gram-positive bacteria)]